VNVKLASALAFAGGVGVGALAMWRAADSHFRKKADAEISDMEQFYLSRQAEFQEMAENAVEEFKERLEETERSDETTEIIGEAASALLEYQGEPADGPTPTFEYIVLLTQREYEQETPDDYDQVTVTYWALDGILSVSPEDTKQLDVIKAIGNIDPAWFGQKSDYPDVCYVRNTRMKIDFEVVRSLESYGKTVLGLGEESG
jgi:hypothetical protein